MHIIRPDFRRKRYSVQHAVRRIRIRRRKLSAPTFVTLGALATLCAYLVWGNPVDLEASISATRAEARNIHVVDGDTVRSEGNLYRLVGLNAPEAGRNARCEQERSLAANATRRLSKLVDGGGVDLERVSCACPRGTEGTRRCNYERLCATLRVKGRDVGAILISEGFAERYVCWGTSCPPRKNWCAS